jgi:hypothetical protein
MQPDEALREFLVLQRVQALLLEQVVRLLQQQAQQVFPPLLLELVQRLLHRLSLQQPSSRQLSWLVPSSLECRRHLRLVHRQALQQLSWLVPSSPLLSSQAFLLLAGRHALVRRVRPYGEHGRLEHLPLSMRSP